MNGFWVKSFIDNSQEYGRDQDIEKGKASWSRGRLLGIKEVVLADGAQRIKLQVDNTEWHQFDRFEVSVAIGTPKSTKVYRAIQAKIQSHHIGLSAEIINIDQGKLCRLVRAKSAKELKISSSNVGSWLTVVLPISKEPYLVCSLRGKITTSSS